MHFFELTLSMVIIRGYYTCISVLLDDNDANTEDNVSIDFAQVTRDKPMALSLGMHHRPAGKYTAAIAF